MCCVLRSGQICLLLHTHSILYTGTTNQGCFGQVQEVWVWPICIALPSHLLPPSSGLPLGVGPGVQIILNSPRTTCGPLHTKPVISRSKRRKAYYLKSPFVLDSGLGSGFFFFFFFFLFLQKRTSYNTSATCAVLPVVARRGIDMLCLCLRM